MTHTEEEYTKIKVNEKSEYILNNLLNYFEKENPNNDLSYKWYFTLNLYQKKIISNFSHKQKEKQKNNLIFFK